MARFRAGSFCGHQNQGPSSLANGMTRNSRTIIMSKIRPMQIVDPAWPMLTTSLESMASMVPASTNAAVTATLPEPAMVRIRPVRIPAESSSRYRESNSRL
ncbi:Uncharacterised protein [Mycobacteroides abscessus subsp. massiliense]|nr:Uncharacterised protein [Mycobacteroides abscessus subsp. massiliense]